MKSQITLFIITLFFIACTPNEPKEEKPSVPEVVEIVPEYTLTKKQSHNKFSRSIEPVLNVKSGAIIEAFTEEATDGQLTLTSDTSDVRKLSFEPIHPLTGPVYVEEAEPGDVLAVKLHKIDVGDWGWSAIIPGFGFLSDQFTEHYIRTFNLDNETGVIAFNDKIKLPIRPFAGVLGVAPDTDSLLSTIPPRANGGNMDDPNMTEGTTIYLPIFVKGALFSIGDAHATQGLGEVSGTAIEAPMRFVYELNVIKGGRAISEPQYETDDYYAVTGFGTTIDAATKKAVQFMVDYLVAEHNLTPNDAYMLCSLAGDLHIAEVVDVPNMLVTMHMSKEVLGIK